MSAPARVGTWRAPGTLPASGAAPTFLISAPNLEASWNITTNWVNTYSVWFWVSRLGGPFIRVFTTTAQTGSLFTITSGWSAGNTGLGYMETHDALGELSWTSSVVAIS